MNLALTLKEISLLPPSVSKNCKRKIKSEKRRYPRNLLLHCAIDAVRANVPQTIKSAVAINDLKYFKDCDS